MTEEYLKLRQKNYKTQLANSKKGKSPDSNGIRAEDIKACDDETREMLRQLFNEIIKRNNFTPDEWEKVKIKVLHKKTSRISGWIQKNRPDNGPPCNIQID